MKKENTPQISTERLILRKFTENDTEAVLQIFGDKEVNQFLPWFPLESIADAKEFLLNRFLTGYANETAYRYAVTRKDDQLPIGYVNISDLGQSNDFGYGLRKEFWHKGIITEAARAVISRLREADFPFITATHDINNPNSGEVMKKLGMIYRYSYHELVQPKNHMVTFRMYQLNLDGKDRLYTEYQEKYPSFVEQL